MKAADKINWQKKAVNPDKVLEKIEPGMSIFLGTGVAEPRTLVKALQASEEVNLQDLELIQLVSLGDAISIALMEKKGFRHIYAKAPDKNSKTA